jgi:hypothetical protein
MSELTREERLNEIAELKSKLLKELLEKFEEIDFE